MGDNDVHGRGVVRRRGVPSRRRMLQALGAGTAVGLAGCLGVFDSDDGEDVELLGPDGERVELALVYVQGTEAVATTAEYIAQELAGVGIEVGLESVSFDRLLQQYVRNRHVGEGEPEWTAGPNNAGPREETASERDWDLMFGITFNTYPRTPAATDAFWLERSPTNFYGYVPEADLASRFEAFRTTVEPNERRATIAEVFGILSEDQPVNFLSMSDDIGGYRRGVQGPVEEFGGNWDSTTWYVDEGAGRTVGERWIAGEASDAEGLYFPEITDGASSARVNLTLDGAYDVDENNEVRPLWMDITDTGDGQVYVCGLRDNLEWGDGYGQMTAEDWLYQIENVHTIDGGQDHPWDQDSPPSTQVADWAQIENVEQTGELEFQLELESVSPDFPLEPVLWGAYCAPAELYEEYVPDANALRTSDEFTQLTFTGNLGPYEFAGWERSAEFVATRNEDYYMREHAEEMGEEWADAPYFDRYSYRVIEEQATRLEALAGGEITATSIPPGRYHDFVENDEVDVYEVPQPFLTIVAYNQRANGWEELRTREVRQALSMAVDKRTVTEDIFRGLAEWTHTYQPRWSEWYDDERITEFGVDDSYDVEGARELLTEHTSEGYEYA